MSKAKVKTTIIGKVKKIIATSLVAVTLATSFSLSPVGSIKVEAKCPEQGHTTKVSMKPFIWSTLELNPTYTAPLDAVIKECGIHAGMTEYEAVYRIDTWITENIKYDYDDSTAKYEHSYLTTLKYKEGVCSDYADLFTALCDRIGIKSDRQRDDIEDHEWNRVKVDGVWYHIDTCWNTISPKKWFLLTEAEMLKDHRPLLKNYDGNRSDSYFTKYAYTSIKGSITYKLNGGKLKSSNIKSFYTVGSKGDGYELYSSKLNHNQNTRLNNYKFKNPTRKGYIFKGWYVGSKKVTALKQIKGKKSVTLTAKWTKVKKPTISASNIGSISTKIADGKPTIFVRFNNKNSSTRYSVKIIDKSNNKTVYTGEDWFGIMTPVKSGSYKVVIKAYKQKDSAGNKIYSNSLTYNIQVP